MLRIKSAKQIRFSINVVQNFSYLYTDNFFKQYIASMLKAVFFDPQIVSLFSLLRLRLCTDCVMDLNKWSEMIIFEPILTTFESSVIYRGSWGSSVNWLKRWIKPP